MLIKGKIESFDNRTVSGWIAIVGDESRKPRLELILDGKALQAVPVDRHREDLAQAGMNGGDCSFELKLARPLTDEQAARVRLRLVGSDLCLELPRREVEPKTPAPDPAALKVFIVGSARSGTSVLLRALQAIFNLPARGESHVIPAVARVVHGLAQFYEQFHDNNDDILIKSLPIERIENSVFRQVRDFYDVTFGNAGWIDKTPSVDSVHSAGLILRIFPEAKIIVTQRNGIEVVASFRKKFNASLEDAANNWVRAMDGITILKKSHPDLLVVDQYDFTNAAPQVAEKIAGYLGRVESIDPLSAFLYGDRQDQLSNHDWARHTTLDDVDWSEAEKSLFLQICQPTMIQFGYPLFKNQPLPA